MQSVSDNLKNLKLDVGSQYLCSASIDVPNTPEILRTLKSPPHLNLIVDVSVREASDVKNAYELRLSLRGFGYAQVPKDNEDADTIYQSRVVYAGLFGVHGEENFTGKDRESFLVKEASGYIFPTARTILLDLIRESGFSVSNPQPIDFREFWTNSQKK